MNTNDEQAEYGAKREPLLSDEALRGVITYPGGAKRHEHEMGAYEVRDFYESKITSGELIRRDELVKWLKDRMAVEEEMGNRADTTNMVARHDWIHTALREVVGHINKKDQ